MEIFRISREVKGISVKLLDRFSSSLAQIAETREESTPPDKKVQIEHRKPSVFFTARPGEGNLFFHRIFKRIGMRQAFSFQ